MTQAFNLSQLANNVNTNGQVSLTAGVSGTLPVANGGTGAATLAANQLLLGNGTGAVSVLANGTVGQILTANSSGAPSFQAAPITGVNYALFTTNATWSVPAGVSKALFWVWGGGGYGDASGNGNFAYGGHGGYACVFVTSGLSPTATLTIVIGAGANTSSANGGTTSVSSSLSGTMISCTGGQSSFFYSGTNYCTHGAATVNVGTTLRSGAGGDYPFPITPRRWASSYYAINESAGQAINGAVNSVTWSANNAAPPGYGNARANGFTNSVGNGGAVLIQY